MQRGLRLREMNQADLSKALGFNDRGNVSRWVTGKNGPNPEMAVRVATALGRPPLEALVAAGHITHEAAQLSQIPPDAAQFSDAELVLAVERRLSELRNATVHQLPPFAAEDAEATPTHSVSQGATVEQDNYALARRRTRGESEGRAIARAGRELGEESQDSGGDDPA